MEKELVEYIAKSLVDDPTGVVVNMIEGEKSTILELKVSEDDIGKVIGKHGRIAKAIRRFSAHLRQSQERELYLRFLIDVQNSNWDRQKNARR